MPCITTSTTLPVETLDDGSATIYYVVVSQENSVTITFVCDGTITSINNNPTPPRPAGHSITFTSAHLDQTFTVTVEYTAATRDSPLQTPSKVPKFKPVTSCPS